MSQDWTVSGPIYTWNHSTSSNDSMYYTTYTINRKELNERERKRQAKRERRKAIEENYDV